MKQFRKIQQALEKFQKQNKLNNRILTHAVLAAVCIVLTVVLIFSMAAAWYSNVVEMDSLQFQADPWGFSSTVKMDEAILKAAPGDSGIVTLSVENPSGDMIAMAIGASKSQLIPEMQQRIYFYVDAAKGLSDEAVQRTWLSSTSNYDYTILPGGTVSMSPSYSNVEPVHWMWVYDMLGYYVQGRWEGDHFIAAEYLRPVEYDYDRANFDAATDRLAAVNCTAADPDGTPIADFVAALTAADGYEGTAQADAAHPGWYKIAVNETGLGVWMYLCSNTEILAANAFDTALGDAAYTALKNNTTPATYGAHLLVIGQRKELISETVDNAQQLQEALTQGTGDRIVLNQNMTLDQMVSVQPEKETILDLQGHSLTVSGAGSGLQVQEGSCLSVTNGTLVGMTANYAIETIGAEVMLDNVTIENTKRGISVSDYKAVNAGDSHIYITNCNIDADECGVAVMGNGASSSAKTKVIIEDCTINSDYLGITGNGTRGGTDILVKNSSVTGKWAAVYHPQKDSAITIINCDMSGVTGVVAKAGEVTIDSSRIKGTLETAYDPAAYSSGDGFLDTGDAVYIECNYATDITVRISGSSALESAANYPIRKFEEAAEHGTFIITGGTFKGRPCTLSQYVPQEGYHITGDGTAEVTVTPAGG